MQDAPEAASPPKAATTDAEKPASRRKSRAAAAPTEAASPDAASTEDSAQPAAADPAAPAAPAATVAESPPAQTAAEPEPRTPSPKSAPSDASKPAAPDPMATALEVGQNTLQSQSNALAAYVTMTTQWTQHWQTLFGASLKLQQQITQQLLSTATGMRSFGGMFDRKDDGKKG